MAREFDENVLDRYSRQIVLPEVGGKGQEKIASTSVLVVGMGGLGCPVVQNLAASGTGEIIMYDSDVVARSDLHRQILYRTDQIGEKKVHAAKNTLSGLNPEVCLVAEDQRLRKENIGAEIENHQPDIVVEGSDNFSTKFLVNDCCVRKGIPLVIGGIFKHQGQILSVLPERSACYRCFFESPPPQDRIPDCSEAGVLGPLTSIVGSVQAYEVLRLLLGFGRPLLNRLLTIQMSEMEFRTVPFRENPRCSVCSRDEPLK